MQMHSVSSCCIIYDILTNGWKLVKFLKCICESQQNLSHKFIIANVLCMPHIYKFIYLYMSVCVYACMHVCLCIATTCVWRLKGNLLELLLDSYHVNLGNSGLQAWELVLLSTEPSCHSTLLFLKLFCDYINIDSNVYDLEV